MRPLGEIAATLERLPDVLGALFAGVDEDVLRTRPEPGEWCPLEVVGHLIACDGPAFTDRIASIIAGIDRLRGFDPWAAINARDFAAGPVDQLLDELRSSRIVAADFVRRLDPEQLTRTGHFGDERRFTAADFVHEWPFHDQDHLQQILAATKLAYPPSMSPDMRTALGV